MPGRRTEDRHKDSEKGQESIGNQLSTNGQQYQL